MVNIDCTIKCIFLYLLTYLLNIAIDVLKPWELNPGLYTCNRSILRRTVLILRYRAESAVMSGKTCLKYLKQ